MLETDIESELIDACRRGNTRMYGAIVRAHEAQALRFAMGMLGDGDAARDATQDAFVLAYRGLDRFQPGRPFGPWLLRILRNRCIDELRRMKARTAAERSIEERDADVHGRTAGPERAMRQRAAGAALRTALDRISVDHRQVIVLRDIDGASYEEMAQVLEAPVGTIASRLYHARRALREALEAMGITRLEEVG